jgi:NTP pyrophosphatase (non-canonical NTP hydrolase)
MEEMSELVKAISKYERGLCNSNGDITEELADVLLVMEYVKYIYNVDKKELKRITKMKKRRLKERMKSK